MKRYEPSTPRVAAAIGALAMTLITFGLAIVVPATLLPGGEEKVVTTQLAPTDIERTVVADIAAHRHA